MQILQDNEISRRRLTILDKIKPIKKISTIIDSWCNPTIIYNASIKENDEIKNFITSNQIFVIYEMCSYDELSKNTFIQSEERSSIIAFKQKIMLFKEICKTVQQMHSINIFHFDLKPENILASETDFRIIDFGAAQEVENNANYQIVDAALSDNERIAFTHIATEQFSPNKYDGQAGHQVCQKFDVFSLGCTLYFMLTKSYLDKLLLPKYKQTQVFIQTYGVLAFMLIQGMTEADFSLRYSLNDVLKHPIFEITEKIEHFIDNQNQIKLKNIMSFDTKILFRELEQLSQHFNKPERSHSQCKFFRHKNFITDDLVIQQIKKCVQQGQYQEFVKLKPYYAALQEEHYQRELFKTKKIKNDCMKFLLQISAAYRISNIFNKQINQKYDYMELFKQLFGDENEEIIYIPVDDIDYDQFQEDYGDSDEFCSNSFFNETNSIYKNNANILAKSFRCMSVHNDSRNDSSQEYDNHELIADDLCDIIQESNFNSLEDFSESI